MNNCRRSGLFRTGRAGGSAIDLLSAADPVGFGLMVTRYVAPGPAFGGPFRSLSRARRSSTQSP